MTRKPLTITSNKQLHSQLHQLQAGDFINCRIRLKPQEEHILLDLTARGVKIFPSATAQLASRSKVFQARIFRELMLPDTVAVYDLNGLMETITTYHQKAISEVVLKLDGKNGGMGVLKFANPEDVYNAAIIQPSIFPFVLQPFISDYSDVRVILVGDYKEAYRRFSASNFRQNLHTGAQAETVKLSEAQLAVCEKAMQRGDFPYCHIDLLIMEEQEKVYLNEINLRGGMRGATITKEAYHQLIDQLHQHQPNTAQSSSEDS